MDSVDITLVLDRSGSMETMKNALLDGSNEFIESQKKTAEENNKKTNITLVTFDDKVDIIFNEEDIKNARKLEYSDICPRGVTRLIDTAVEQIHEQKSRVEKNINEGKYQSCKKIFALLTDGCDNMSLKYKEKDLHTLIKEARENDTLCIFLGANQDAIASGNTFGFSADHSMEYGANETDAGNAMRCLSQEISREASGIKSEGFTNIQRQASNTINTNLKLKRPRNE